MAKIKRPKVLPPQAADTEIAWAAGFFDGEGSWYTRKYPPGKKRLVPYFIVHAQVAQVHRELLDRFHAAVGMLGNVNGPYNKNGGTNRQPYYSWNACGSIAEQVYKILQPYLGPVKRDQFERSVAPVIEQRARAESAKGAA